MNQSHLNGLQSIRDFYAKNSILPTYSEIVQYSVFRSKSQVHELVHTLIDNGYFKFSSSKRLIPMQKFFDDTYMENVK